MSRGCYLNSLHCSGMVLGLLCQVGYHFPYTPAVCFSTSIALAVLWRILACCNVPPAVPHENFMPVSETLLPLWGVIFGCSPIVSVYVSICHAVVSTTALW